VDPDDDLFRFELKNNAMVIAKTASTALLQWNGEMRQIPCKVGKYLFLETWQPNLSCLPYDPAFLTVILANIERKLGTSPQVPQELLEKSWYEQLPARESMGDIKTMVEFGYPEILFYEETCLALLKWLAEKGDVTDLVYPR